LKGQRYTKVKNKFKTSGKARLLPEGLHPLAPFSFGPAPPPKNI